jgi:WhiB family redox-sensing transcriptional regulator
VSFLEALRPAWMNDGLCIEYPDVVFFPERGQSSAPAKALCGRCLVQRECRQYAIGDPNLVGVWGGTSPRERARLRAGKVSASAA